MFVCTVFHLSAIELLLPSDECFLSGLPAIGTEHSIMSLVVLSLPPLKWSAPIIRNYDVQLLDGVVPSPSSWINASPDHMRLSSSSLDKGADVGSESDFS